MSDTRHNSEQCILPSELSPEQLESLPFVPGSLSSFNEKEMLPPTARAQWTYIQVNPSDFLNRFITELGLIGINVALCFINKERYEDKEKDLETPITVHLIVKPDHFKDLQKHLLNKRLSHHVMEDNKGFALPYLGSIQKTIDVLGLESLMNYVFIKNSISRESYINWLSVPKSYLDRLHSKTQSGNPRNDEEATGEASPSDSNPRPLDDSETQDPVKENFNYVIYDESEEIEATNFSSSEHQNPDSLVADASSKSKGNSFLGRLGKTASKKSKGAKDRQRSSLVSSTSKLESSLFLSLGLFNFYCSILLVSFLGNTVDVIQSILLEAVAISALVSLLFAFFVIRPRFKNAGGRVWAPGAYAVYFGVAGYEIFQSSQMSGNLNYITPSALAAVFLTTAVISGFLRIDRLSLHKSEKINTLETDQTQKISHAPKPPIPGQSSIPEPPAIAGNFPPPSKRKEKTKGIQKIALKLGKQTLDQPVEQSEKAPAGSISEAQKEVIRNRLTRPDRPSIPERTHGAEINSSPDEESTRRAARQPLSTREIRAKLATRLEQARSVRESIPSETKSSEPTKELQGDALGGTTGIGETKIKLKK